MLIPHLQARQIGLEAMRVRKAVGKRAARRWKEAALWKTGGVNV